MNSFRVSESTCFFTLDIPITITTISVITISAQTVISTANHLFPFFSSNLFHLSRNHSNQANIELARRWGVYENCIRQDQAQIRKMIREKLKK